MQQKLLAAELRQSQGQLKSLQFKGKAPLIEAHLNLPLESLNERARQASLETEVHSCRATMENPNQMLDGDSTQRRHSSLSRQQC